MYKPDHTVEEYLYARTSDRMKRFLIEKLTGEDFFQRKIAFFYFSDFDNLPTDSIGIFKLNDLTFDPFINKNKNVVVKFVTPGCGHCNSYKKVYDEVVIQFLMEESEDIKFAEINCKDKDSLNVCLEEGVQDFPTTHTYKVFRKHFNVRLKVYIKRMALLKISSLRTEQQKILKISSGKQLIQAE